VFETFFPQLIGLCTGALLLTSALMVWRHSLLASIRLLALQGVALAALVAVIGIAEGESELVLVSLLILSVKGIGLPWVLAHQSKASIKQIQESPRLNPTAALLAVTLLTILSYVVMSRVFGLGDTTTGHAAPIGLAMVLIGFLLLDNGIATIAFLTSGGVPILLEFAVSLDVLLVVLILHVFAGRMRTKFGGTAVDQLRELHD
jgi:hydrogenase-4 component E